MINDVQLQLQQVKDAWDSVTSLPDEFSTLGFPELTKVEISDVIGGAITILDAQPPRGQAFTFYPLLSNLYP